LLVFDPMDGFTVDPTPISYVLTEVLTGLTDETTVTISYIGVNPTAEDDDSSGYQPGDNATVNILENDEISDGGPANVSIVTIELVDPVTGAPSSTPSNLIVIDEGQWTFDSSTGNITFDPNPGFTTDPTPVDYVLTENITGFSDQAKVTINYIEANPQPGNDLGEGFEPGFAATLNILENDKLSDSSQATTTNTTVELVDPETENPTLTPNSVEIRGEGQWTYNTTNGELTFDPEDGFTSDPTALDYVLTETLTSLSDNASVVFDYSEKPPVAENDSTNSPVAENVLLNILQNDKLSDGSNVSADKVGVELIDPTNSTSAGTTLNLAVEGQWTYMPESGELIFEPAEGFYNDPTPVDYILSEILTGLSDTATVKIKTSTSNNPPTAQNDFVEAGDCAVVIINVLENDSDPDEDDFTTPTIIEDVESGTVTVNADGTIDYTPERGFEGTVVFTYEICDVKESDTPFCARAEVEITVMRDTDCDKIPDAEDIDDDNDGILDIDEGAGNTDTDGDGLADNVDIDADGDGITDNVEWQTNDDYIAPAGTDSNGNGWDDAYDSDSGGNYYTAVDSDDDGVPDYLDTDSDGDNIPDSNEGHDADNDVLADVVPSGVDSDGDGLDDTYDAVDGWNKTGNSTGSFSVMQDYDNDNIPDWRDLDDDNDGNPTTGVDDKITDCELLVPEIFSPNGDGIQDYFRIVCIKEYPEARIEIFNRWGNLVFEKENYGNTDVWGNTDAWWNGYSSNSGKLGTEKLPAGTYFYVLYLTNSGNKKNGFVFLNR